MRKVILPVLWVLASFTVAFATVPDGGVVTLKGRKLLAEVARTEREREVGLAYRSTFKAERCLFVIPEGEGLAPVRTAKFLLPFDVIWIDEEGTVVEVLERIPPCKVAAACPEHGGTKPSRYHIFLAAGMVQRLKLRAGDKVLWDIHFGDGTDLRRGPHAHVDPKTGRP